MEYGHRSLLLVLALAGSVCSCNKAGAAGSKDPCADANYKNPNPAFCLKTPPGFSAQPVKVVGKESRLSFDIADHTRSFTVSWGGYASLADAEPFIKGMLDDPKNEKKGGGDVPGRQGKYYWVNFKDGGTGQSEVFVQSKNNVFVCYVNETQEQIKELVDSCLTLYAP